MADLNEENVITEGVSGGIGVDSEINAGTNTGVDVGNNPDVNAGTIQNTLPAKTTSFWARFKAFWLQEIDWNKEIKVELTPHQQKIEDEINEFLHHEITWKKVKNFLFQEIKF